MDAFEAGELIRVILNAYRYDHEGELPPQRIHTLAFQFAEYLTRRRAGYGHLLGESLGQQGVSLGAVYAVLVGMQRTLIERGDPPAALDIAERMATVIAGYVAQQTRAARSELEHLRAVMALPALFGAEDPDASLQGRD